MSSTLQALSVPLASIPSPPESMSVIHIGSLNIHMYALCILTGIGFCLWLGAHRWEAVGGEKDDVYNVAMWAIPAGILGARAYHVLITDPGSYFGPNVADPWAFLKIWEGGIGIMGAVSVGALGAWYACRRYGLNFPAFGDAIMPGILLAQAFGRWGNWFNQELFGKPTTLPWGLEIDYSSPNFPKQYPAGTLFHPTFLYESLWNLAGVALLLWLSRKGALKLGQTIWLYVLYYGIGRFFIEVFLRIDTSETFLGLRVHIWTSGLLVVAGLLGFITAGMRARAREAAGLEPLPARLNSVEDSAASEDASEVEESSDNQVESPKDESDKKSEETVKEPSVSSAK